MTLTSPDNDLLTAVREMTKGAGVLTDEVRTLKKYGQRNRHLIKVVALSVAFDIALSIGLGWAVLKANDASNKATKASSTAVVSCTAANTTNEIQKKLWATLFTFPPPANETATEKAQRLTQTATFKSYIDKAFAPRDCSKVGQ